MTWLLVAAGAAVGAALRAVLSTRLTGLLPWGTLMANVVGSFLLGLLTGLVGGLVVGSAVAASAPGWQALLGVGLCGALTTYSAFGFEAVVLAEGRERLLATLYVLATLALGLVAALSGLALGALLA